MQYEHHGFTIRIEEDDNGWSESPREWGTVGTILSFHQHGDHGELSKADIEIPDDAVQPTTEQEALELWIECVKAQFGATVVLPVWHYTHSGTTIRVAESNPFSCPWDSGLMGLIFDTPAGLKSSGYTEWDADQIENSLQGEIEAYDMYLRGEVYGFVVESPEGDNVESCWGFYGDPEKSGCKDEAENMAVWHAKKRVEEDTKINRCMAL